MIDDIVKRCIDGNMHTNGIGGLLPAARTYRCSYTRRVSVGPSLSRA